MGLMKSSTSKIPRKGSDVENQHIRGRRLAKVACWGDFLGHTEEGCYRVLLLSQGSKVFGNPSVLFNRDPRENPKMAKFEPALVL